MRIISHAESNLDLYLDQIHVKCFVPADKVVNN